MSNKFRLVLYTKQQLSDRKTLLQVLDPNTYF